MLLNGPNFLSGVRALRRACVVLLAAAACGGDGPTEPVQTAGSMSFTYSGAVSGSFAVTGVPGPASDGASAVRFSGSPSLLIVAGGRDVSATHRDFLQMWLSDVTGPRTISLDVADCFATALDCPLVIFGRNVPKDLPEPDTEIEGFYLFASGSVNVTAVNASRIVGTFQGTAESLTLEGTPVFVTIANGKFDVPLMSTDDLE